MSRDQQVSTSQRRSRLALMAATAALTLIVWLPAAWIRPVVNQHPGIGLAAASGTIWHGRALLSAGAYTVPGWWQWDLDGLSVLTGQPRIRLQHPWLAEPVTAQWHWTHWELSAGTLKLPIAAAATLVPRLALVQPNGGELRLLWPAFSTKGHPIRRLNLQWQNASSALVDVAPLGDYDAQFQFVLGQPITLTLKTLQGPLQLNGNGVIERKGAWHFNGSAQAISNAPAAQGALETFLRVLGRPSGNRTTIEWNGA